jgi:1-aminocyclopropane-1-carboxylate deaminase/D-cysteine desulfhydrase-like pyridoxal-dependent ACC family enzyme
MVELMNKNKFDANDDVLFMHTGGLLGLMAQRAAFHPFV